MVRLKREYNFYTDTATLISLNSTPLANGGSIKTSNLYPKHEKRVFLVSIPLWFD
ncbi:MAG: hypothetical protein WHT45_12665 [Ignavibacterium sp.]